jgi:hypothetical protein
MSLQIRNIFSNFPRINMLIFLYLEITDVLRNLKGRPSFTFELSRVLSAPLSVNSFYKSEARYLDSTFVLN